MRLPITVVAVGLGAMLLAAPTVADETIPGASTTVTKIDFRGHPPFKRRSVTVPVEDIASLETIEGKRSGKYATVSTVDFKGRPPFKRSTETLPVEDIASFETGPLGNGETNKMRFHGKPPYRR